VFRDRRAVGVSLPGRGMAAGVRSKREDGSSWRAFVAPEEGDRVRRSAFYALQDASDGPAKAAYAARVARPADYPKPESPAVDAGSDDAWGYDSTSTNPKVIDLSQPDIGYKYYRRVADDDDPDGTGEDAQEIMISFRPPKEEVVEIIQFPLRVTSQGERYIVYDRSKEVVEEPLGFRVERGDYMIDVSTQGAGDSNESVPAEIRLVVDPDPPTIE